MPSLVFFMYSEEETADNHYWQHSFNPIFMIITCIISADDICFLSLYSAHHKIISINDIEE